MPGAGTCNHRKENTNGNDDLLPVWCDRTLGHEYEDETHAGEPLSHHERQVLALTAVHFGNRVDVSMTVGSTEQVTLGPAGVEVKASPPTV
jgi:hypothetical protein